MITLYDKKIYFNLLFTPVSNKRDNQTCLLDMQEQISLVLVEAQMRLRRMQEQTSFVPVRQASGACTLALVSQGNF